MIIFIISMLLFTLFIFCVLTSICSGIIRQGQFLLTLQELRFEFSVLAKFYLYTIFLISLVLKPSKAYNSLALLSKHSIITLNIIHKRNNVFLMIFNRLNESKYIIA
jgi:hypothetical protein